MIDLTHLIQEIYNAEVNQLDPYTYDLHLQSLSDRHEVFQTLDELQLEILMINCHRIYTALSNKQLAKDTNVNSSTQDG